MDYIFINLALIAIYIMLLILAINLKKKDIHRQADQVYKTSTSKKYLPTIEVRREYPPARMIAYRLSDKNNDWSTCVKCPNCKKDQLYVESNTPDNYWFRCPACGLEIHGFGDSITDAIKKMSSYVKCEFENEKKRFEEFVLSDRRETIPMRKIK